MKEPIKYEQREVKGQKQWRVTQEWKDWKNPPKANGNGKVAQPKHITAENHRPVWKEAASTPGSERKIYFCVCKATTGSQFDGCGAVAVRANRNSDLEIVIEPRFE